MITDSQAQEILEAIQGMTSRLDGIDGRLDGIDGRLNKLDQTVDSLVVEVASHGQILQGLVTRDEFNIFKDETLTHFDGLAGQIANLQEVEALRMKTS